jgi:uncharacterized membrane protein YbhN (UPF0104 family)
MSENPELAQGAVSPSSRRGLLRTYLSRVIIAAGVVWVVFVFWREIPNLDENLRINSWFWLVYTIVAGAVAQMLLVPVFRMILNHTGGVQVSYLYAARLLFVAQILRHLPGRLWGIVYLVKETRQSIPPAAMIRANLDVMFYSMTFSIVAAGMLALGAIIGTQIAAVFVVISLVGVAISIRKDWTGTVLRKLVRLVPARAAQYQEALKLHESLPWPLVLSIVAYFVLAWCFFLSIWWAVARVYEAFDGINIWLLCASYSAAWVIGYITMITPGGLGVREAGFIALSAKLTTLPNLTFLAIFFRLWQIFVEFILFLAFAFIKQDPEVDKK